MTALADASEKKAGQIDVNVIANPPPRHLSPFLRIDVEVIAPQHPDAAERADDGAAVPIPVNQACHSDCNSQSAPDTRSASSKHVHGDKHTRR